MGNKHSKEPCDPTEVNANTQARATQAKTMYNQYTPTPIPAWNVPAVSPVAQRRAIPFGAAHPEPMPVVDQSTTVFSNDSPVPNGADAHVEYVQVDMTN